MFSIESSHCTMDCISQIDQLPIKDICKEQCLYQCMQTLSFSAFLKHCRKAAIAVAFPSFGGITSTLEMIVKVYKRYAFIQKAAVIQEWDYEEMNGCTGLWLKRRSVATQEVGSNRGSVRLSKRRELAEEACCCAEVRGCREGIRRRCEVREEVVVVQEVCGCVGGVQL